jgi:MerR family copper efflux transcriptional regulator
MTSWISIALIARGAANNLLCQAEIERNGGRRPCGVPHRRQYLAPRMIDLHPYPRTMLAGRRRPPSERIERRTLLQHDAARTGQRSCGGAAAERLRQIQLAQRLGFSLEEMRTAVVEISKAGLLERIDRRLREIDELRAKLDGQRAELHEIRDALQAEWAAGRCFKIDQFESSAPAAAKRRRTGRKVASHDLAGHKTPKRSF